MNTLFTPYTLKSVTLRNRIGVAPMAMFAAANGIAGDWHLAHLGSYALGGAGLIIAEGTAVSLDGRISMADTGLWDDRQIEPWSRITAFLKQQGTVPGIQLAHSGRKGSASAPWEGGLSLRGSQGGWTTLGPSPIAFGGRLDRVPREMDLADLQTVQRQFSDAARRALAAGFRWLELHAAHGFLLHSFQSPLSNRRTDGYGGSFENRVRLTLETVRCVRAVWPGRLPLTVRVSSSDWVDGGWTLDDTVNLARLLKHEGVDLIDVSTGGSVPDKRVYSPAPGWLVPHAARIRWEAEVPTAAGNMLSDPLLADTVIRESSADLVLLAREFLRNPHWPLHAAKALGAESMQVLPPRYAHWV